MTLANVYLTRMATVLNTASEYQGWPGASIVPSTPYVVVNVRTGKIVYRTTYAHRNRARAYADKLNTEYGGYLYACEVCN